MADKIINIFLLKYACLEVWKRYLFRRYKRYIPVTVIYICQNCSRAFYLDNLFKGALKSKLFPCLQQQQKQYVKSKKNRISWTQHYYILIFYGFVRHQQVFLHFLIIWNYLFKDASYAYNLSRSHHRPVLGHQSQVGFRYFSFLFLFLDGIELAPFSHLQKIDQTSE